MRMMGKGVASLTVPNGQDVYTFLVFPQISMINFLILFQFSLFMSSFWPSGWATHQHVQGKVLATPLKQCHKTLISFVKLVQWKEILDTMSLKDIQKLHVLFDSCSLNINKSAIQNKNAVRALQINCKPYFFFPWRNPVEMSTRSILFHN